MEGIIIGISTFLIIGLFHPVVIKAEYYWGTRCWWVFLVLGILGIIGSLLIDNILVSSLLGVFAFSSFWQPASAKIEMKAKIMANILFIKTFNTK